MGIEGNAFNFLRNIYKKSIPIQYSAGNPNIAISSKKKKKERHIYGEG